MLFAGGLIPTYLVVQELGLLDTRWALILPQAIGVWQVIIARTFFRTSIPDELYEAAQLDGCSDLRFLWSVVLPLSKPMLAVIALMYAIVQWNCLLRRAALPPEPRPVSRCSSCCATSSSSTPRRRHRRLRRPDAARSELADLLKYSLIVVAPVCRCCSSTRSSPATSPRAS